MLTFFFKNKTPYTTADYLDDCDTFDRIMSWCLRGVLASATLPLVWPLLVAICGQ